MKKISFLLIALVLAFTLSACDNNTSEIATSSQVAVNDTGKYHAENGLTKNQAVNFLNSLDDGKYEVVSISDDKGFYTIFYRDVEWGCRGL